MKKRLFIPVLVLLTVIFCGCASEKGFYPLLSVEGDVDNAISFSAIENDFELRDYTYDDIKYNGYELTDILTAAGVRSENSKIYLMSSDGMMAALDYADLDQNYITFSEKGWEAMNIDYPPSGDVKEIKKIVVADQNEKPEYALVVKTAGDSETVLTCGRMLSGDQTVARKEEGTNEKNSKKVTVYTSVSGYYIPDYLGVSGKALVNIGDSRGKNAFYYADGYLVPGGNMINYLSLTDKETIEDIRSLSLQTGN
ncbi:MAG: hypothetical protein ACOX7J_08515 [Bacillota bacterium]